MEQFQYLDFRFINEEYNKSEKLVGEYNHFIKAMMENFIIPNVISSLYRELNLFRITVDV